MSVPLELTRLGVDTIMPESRDSGLLDWIERGTTAWDDQRFRRGGTLLELNLTLAHHRAIGRSRS